jgi:hypothetical protein
VNDIKKKRCCKCHKNKLIGEFYKDKKSKDGLQTYCKICSYLVNKKWQKENPEKCKQHHIKYWAKSPITSKERQRIWRKNNPDKVKANRKRYEIENCESRKERKHKNYLKDREKILLRSKQNYLKNKDEISLRHKKYESENPEKVKQMHKLSDLKYKKERLIHKKIYRKNRYKTDPIYRTLCCLRARMNYAFKAQNVKKPMHTIELLDCTAPEYQTHLQSHFKPGMTKENNGKRKWIQHHIIKFSSVDLRDMKQLKKVCHYTNVIPMWEDEHKEWHKNNPD